MGRVLHVKEKPGAHHALIQHVPASHKLNTLQTPGKEKGFSYAIKSVGCISLYCFVPWGISGVYHAQELAGSAAASRRT
eukprot:733140-Amphidinium_carterae.1